MAIFFGASSGNEPTKPSQVPSRITRSPPSQSRESDLSALTEDYEHEYDFANGDENNRASFRHHGENPSSASIASLAKDNGALPKKQQSGRRVRILRRSEQFAPGAGIYPGVAHETPSAFLPSLAAIEDTRGSAGSTAELLRQNENVDPVSDGADNENAPRYSF